MDLHNLDPGTLGFARFAYRRSRREWLAVLVVQGTWRLDGAGVLVPWDPSGEEGAPTPGPARHLDDDPAGPPVRPDGLAPFKPRADIVVDAVAHAPGGEPVPGVPVAVQVGGWRKELLAVGDRQWRRGWLRGGYTDPRPFTAMPLHLGRALGGPADAANPWGRGRAGEALPNVEWPGRMVGGRRDRLPPATLGPVPEGHPDRRVAMGTYDRRWLREGWPGPPEDFDWAFFQGAGRDQQVEGYLQGDEELVFENLHPRRPRLEITLPGMRARCFVETESEFAEVPLALDTLWSRPHEETVELTWRGLLPIPGPDHTDGWSAAVIGLEALGTGRPAASYREAGRELAAAWESQFDVEDDDPEDAAWWSGGMPPPPGGVPPADPEVDALDRATDAQLADLRGTLGAEGMVVEAASGDPAAGLTELGTDEELRRALQARGQDLDALVAGIGDDWKAASAAFESADDRTAEPDDPRARVTRRLERGVPLTGAELAGADLSGLDLSEKDLTGADLSDADLSGADLRRARLPGADLSGALLRGSRLDGADLTGAWLGSADLSEACLEGADLSGADLSEVKVVGVRWQGACLAETDLSVLDLSGAALRGLHAPGATFTDVDLGDADLREAGLAGAVLAGCRLVGARLDGADLEKADLSGSDLTRARLRRARLLNAAGDGETRLVDADLFGSVGRGACFGGVDASGALLAGADFRGALLPGAGLRGADLRAVRLGGASLDGADLRDAELLRADLVGAGLARTDLRGADLRGAWLYDACLDETLLEGARLDEANLANTVREARS